MTHVPVPYRPSTARLALGLSAAALALSVMGALQDFRRPKPPVFISVSIKSLLEEHMVSMLGRDLAPAEAEWRTADYIAALEAAIASLAQEEGVIIIAGEAVLGGGAPDFTDDIRTLARAEAERRAAARGENLPPPGDLSGLDAELGRLSQATEELRLQAGLEPGGRP